MVNWGKLIFGGVDSSEYGIYITGEGVYNAPERAVEFVDVPGRNGAIALDQGRYENITVTYPAGVFGKDPEEFREALSDFRNAILSQRGYQRLEDTYHPEEFREAIYVAGLEVEANQKKAGRFELTFNCKPQRWLTVGSLPIPVDSGDILQNPTRFDSSPLVEVEGYGAISFNGYEIILSNETLRKIELLNNSVSFNGLSGELTFSEEYVNNGDPITVGVSFNERIFAFGVSAIKSKSYTQPSTGSIKASNLDSTGNMYVETSGQTFSFNAGTDSSQSDTAQVNMTYQRLGLSTIYNCEIAVSYNFDYDASAHKLRYETSYAITFDSGSGYNDFQTNNPSGGSFNSIEADSSVSILGHPTYIDCDLGECYKADGGDVISLNQYIDLGSDLPTLAPGSNKITFDNTVTDLKVAPRWWRV